MHVPLTMQVPQPADGEAGAGVGPEVADAILKHYPTAAALLKAFRECRRAALAQGADVEAACVKLLAAVPVTLSRKVGACASRQLYQALFAAPPNSSA
jgi:hypothetical protein